MTASAKPTTHFSSLSAGHKLASDSSSHPDPENTYTPSFTSSRTPSQVPSSEIADLADLENIDGAKMDAPNDGASKAKEEAQPVMTDNSGTQTEAKLQDPGDVKVKKSVCKRHSKGSKKSKRRSKAKEEPSSSSDNSSSTESSSSSESEETTDSDSSSEEDIEAARKRKLKLKKAKKLKEKKKAKSRKHKEASEEGSSDESSDESSSEEEGKKKRSKSKKSRRSKKHRKEDKDSETEENADDPLALVRAQVNALNLRRSHGRRPRGGRLPVDDRLLKRSLRSKSKGKKKKRYAKARSFGAFANSSCRGSKVDFVRVDQLWDSSIHNYKLTETAEDADADEYDQYVFTVRRKFDWENKYTETVVDIKSKPLKEALTYVMGAVKGARPSSRALFMHVMR